MKHLLYEQQHNITTLKSDAELALKLQQDEFSKREAELHRDKRALKQELKEQVSVVRGKLEPHHLLALQEPTCWSPISIVLLC